MNCRSCDRPLPDDAAFCGYCGSSLRPERVCPSCGRSNSADMRFCLGCGAGLVGVPEPPPRDPLSYTPKHLADKILRSKSAIEGERKQVTVLFADVKGSMELQEEVDPEVWHGIMDRFFQILTEGVHRFEGTVNQYTGDGIMALFGAPIAHEDHPQRACYAALHLRDELRRYAEELKRSRGLGFAVRMGLNSGEVVVGKIGDDLRMDYTAQGQTVGLAARLQSLADAGAIYVGPETSQKVSGYFELRDLGGFQIKGVRETVQVFALERPGPMRSRFDVSKARGLSRFVGRADEMDGLEAALERAKAGESRIVAISAPAGVGKSRLCFEFAERCRARGIRVVTSACPSYGKGIPLLQMLSSMRSYFGIEDRDDEETARNKIAGAMTRADPELAVEVPFMLDLLGVPDPRRPVEQLDPEARQRKLLEVTMRLRGARAELIVFVAEDLHWIDPASETILHQLALSSDRPTLQVLNFRPEYRLPWAGRPNYREITLEPLGERAVSELLRELLGPEAATDELVDRIHRRAGGNPFFVEEIVQSLVETGHLAGARGTYRLTEQPEVLEIPDTVHAVLASRIDRLHEREKRVLQAASVIGRTFATDLLEQLAPLAALELPAVLQTLCDAEYLYIESVYPEQEYTFKHPLTQEVAYNSQLQQTRQVSHRALAAQLVEIRKDKLDEAAALIAHHWEAAAEPGEAARWHTRAGEWAGTRDVAAAARHAQKVLDLLQEHEGLPDAAVLGSTACQRLLISGMRIRGSEAEAARIFEVGKRLVVRSADEADEARLEIAYAQALSGLGALDAALEHAVAGRTSADRTGDLGLRCDAHWAEAFARMCLGDLRGGQATGRRLIEEAHLHPELGRSVAPTNYSFILMMDAGFEAWIGDLAEAQRRFREGVRLCRESGEVEGEAFLLGEWSDVARMTGEVENALGRCEAAQEIAERIGNPMAIAWSCTYLAQVLTVAGQAERAVEQARRGLKLVRERQITIQGEPRHCAQLAEALLAAGDLDGARRAAEEGVAVGQRIGARFYEAWAQHALAAVLIEQEGANAALDIRAALDRAEALCQKAGAKNWQPCIHEQRAYLARALGDTATRERELREAHRLFTEIGATGHAARIAREIES